jgi:hypothetical protein
MQTYPLQVIAMDRVARHAVELAELTHFEEVGETLPSELAQKPVSGHRQIFVFSEVNDERVETLAQYFSQLEEFIVIVPQALETSEMIKQLVLMGARVFLASSSTVLSLSLAQVLQALEKVFYPDGREEEISVEHKDIYTVLGKGTVVDYYEEGGGSFQSIIMRTLNFPKGMYDIHGALALFEIPDEFPLIEIAEALDIMESILPEEIGIMFVTRRGVQSRSQMRIGCFISRYMDFQKELQSKIN